MKKMNFLFVMTSMTILIVISLSTFDSFAAQSKKNTKLMDNFTFTMTRDSDGKRFYCSEDPNSDPADPNCVPDIATLCREKTTFSRQECFDKASESCPGAPRGYANCVARAYDYCRQETSYDPRACFTQSLRSCR